MSNASKRAWGRAAALCGLAVAGSAQAFDLAVSGLIRQEMAYSLSGDANPLNRGSALVSGPQYNTAFDSPNTLGFIDVFVGGDGSGATALAARDAGLLPAFFPKEDLDKDADWNLMATRAEVDFNMKFTNNLSGFVKVRGYFTQDVMDEYEDPNHFEVDYHGKCAGILEVCDNDYMIDLPSAYLDYQSGPLWIRFGNQQIAWGESIFFRVFDVPNGLDLRRHLFLDFASEEYADERVASPGIRASYNFGNWELEAFAQMFQPSVLPNNHTAYALVNSPFRVRYDVGFDNVDDYINGGIVLRGQVGDLGMQFMAVSRHNPDPIFKWLPGNQASLNPAFAAFGSFADQPFRATSATILGNPNAQLPDSVGMPNSATYGAGDWLSVAGYSGLDGVEALNVLAREFDLVGNFLNALGLGLDGSGNFVSGVNDTSPVLDTFFTFLGDLDADLEPVYASENVFGMGFNYIFYAEPDSLLDQLVVRFEATYTPDKEFTNNLSREWIVEDEWVTSLALEKYHRFSRNFPATFFSLQWLHKSESDFLGRHLSQLGASKYRRATGGEENNGWDAMSFAFQQPFPGLIWRADFALLYDFNGSYLVQPAVRYKPSSAWTFEAFATFIDSKDNAGSLQPLEWADEITLRVGYQF